ncbi:TonB-linked SusC/RagA family outer membrane protein [Nonlabens dokdonensis]|uniref:TonB-linked SusC/RagA family outer membrane protein n=2 Tax=Nonlabens dokdonensis TaxID=328515 RepID=A0ABX5Q0H6_9FLAO|nr:SusC/RagA family TonB-linked outer membrane protein [Nonlabens dokdonensis]AGC75676.1 putative outer membrane protein, probably involved in nutrient binding protein [Nonlabens dokdonensis DSW-6]PZX43364.1 TonB-linked SusC/RagA family outer membrane protein [Nonlabens dokdonensis]
MKTKLNGILTLLLALVVQVAFAQQTVTGKVTGPDGDEIIGATVLIKGTSTFASTDFNGNFTIQASPEDTLVISYTGYDTQEILVGNQTSINVNMQNNSLAEIVITGSVFDVGEERENGVSSMGTQELAATVGPVSIDRAMQGQMSGVNVVANSPAPGASANVNVRGAFSPSAGLQNPLYVVDGTYMNAVDVPAINSNNIASLQVLTDASQTALYGSRGANGVVVITTKSAKSGKSEINFNTRYGFTERFPIRVDLMNSRQKLEFENELSGITNAAGNPIGLGRSLTPAEIDAAAATNTNWGDEYYETGITESYNFSITNGTETARNRFSLGYDNDEGIVRGYRGFERISASFKSDVNVTKKFNIGYTVNGSYSERDDPRDRNNVQSIFQSELRNNPYETLFITDADGNQIISPGGVNGPLNGLVNYQALDEVLNTQQQVRNLRLFGSGFAEYFIQDNLKVRTQFGAVYDRRQSENFLRPAARLNQFIGNPGGTKNDNSIDDLDYNWRNEITYGKSFGVHDIKVTAASEYQSENFYRISLSSQGFPNNFQNTQNLASLITQDGFTDRSRVTRTGLLGVVNYTYDNKYSFNGYVRRDGSSRTGFNNQYGTFFGASGSWNIHKESFMEDVDFVKGLVLTGSYGTLGDDSVLGLYSNFTTISTAGSYGFDNAAIPSTTIANPDVTWETNEKINVGLAFQLLQGSRLRGKVDLFQDTRKDFIFQDDFSEEAGSFTGFNNFGDSRVQGVEIDLSYDILRDPEGLNLTVFGNATFIDAEITSLAVEEEFTGYAGGQVIAREGLEPFTHYLVRYAGVNPANGEALYLDANGDLTNIFSAQNAVAIEDKSPLPSLYGGFGFRADYKGFDLATNFNYTYGNYIYNLQAANMYDASQWQSNRFVGASNFWRQPGDTNVLARPTTAGIETGTTQFLQDGSYLAFRNLTLGYTFNEDQLGKTGVKSLRVYAQGQNLAIWSNFEGNPEVGVGSSENAATINGAVYINNYPQVQSWSFGVDFRF